MRSHKGGTVVILVRLVSIGSNLATNDVNLVLCASLFEHTGNNDAIQVAGFTSQTR